MAKAKNAKTKKITLESLATMIKGEFDNMNDSINTRFEQVDRRFEQVDKRFKEIDMRFDEIDHQLYEIRSDMTSTKNSVMYRSDFDHFMAMEFDDLTGRVKYLETKLSINSGK